MITKNLSIRTFLQELKSLLLQSGISPARLPITTEAGKSHNKIQTVYERYPEVGKVILYMEEHLGENISLEEMAEKVQLSKYQLIRRFRDETGSTPWQYLINQRIRKVEVLLENGMPPSQAANEAGFYDQSHLNKVFREETGLTPKEYQEKNFKNRN